MTFNGAQWLYAVKYYEAAIDIESMLTLHSLKENDIKERKQKLKLIRRIVLIFISLPLIIIDITYVLASNLIIEQLTFKIIVVTSSSLMLLLDLITCWLLALI